MYGRWRTRTRVVMVVEVEERPMYGGGCVRGGALVADGLDFDLDLDIVPRFMGSPFFSSQVVKASVSSSRLIDKP